MRIAIVGAGFSGTMTAVRLLEGAGSTRLEITLLDRSGVMGPGVAYGTESAEHLLNVPAGRMSPFPEDEDAFLRFARERDPGVAPGSFVPRRLYGEFLRSVLDRAIEGRPPHTSLRCLHDEAVAVESKPESREVAVRLANGGVLSADHVVLACGNLPPDVPAAVGENALRDARFVRDPWAPGAFDRAAAAGSILLVGTGLTMLDVVQELAARGCQGPVHVVSRRGLLPQPHRTSSLSGPIDARPHALAAHPASARRMLRAIRRHAARISEDGGDWRDVLASLRSATPELWAALSRKERARFLRHLRPYWETHRHRAAPAPFDALQRRIESGEIVRHAGRIREVRPAPDALEVEIEPRGGGPPFVLRVQRVVNCTGPSSDVATSRDPLLADLRGRGVLCSDAHRIGLLATETGALLDGAGRASETISYVGPFLRAREWEATAVPELRIHAARLAARLSRQAAGARRFERLAGDEPLDLLDGAGAPL